MEFEDNVNWYLISHYQNLSIKFIKLNKPRLYLLNIKINNKKRIVNFLKYSMDKKIYNTKKKIFIKYNVPDVIIYNILSF